MAWTLTHDIDAYRAATGGLLTSQPDRHTVLLSVLENLIRLGLTAFGAEIPLCGWWSEGGVVSAAVLQTPPHPMLLTDLPGRPSSPAPAPVPAWRPRPARPRARRGGQGRCPSGRGGRDVVVLGVRGRGR